LAAASAAAVVVPEAAPLADHEREELGEGEETALGHGVERLEDLLLHVECVVPQRYATVELARVGVHRAAVPNIVAGVGVHGAEDALADQQRLHPDFVRVGHQVLQLVQVQHLFGVVVGRDVGHNRRLGEAFLAVSIPEILFI